MAYKIYLIKETIPVPVEDWIYVNSWCKKELVGGNKPKRMTFSIYNPYNLFEYLIL